VSDGWQRLGRRVKAERGRRGYLTAGELAAAAGLSVRTVETIESGAHTGRPRETTLAKLERALGWQDGSVERILEGGRPRYVTDPLLERVVAVWPQLAGDDQIRVVGLVERLARGDEHV
jgi:transcriptional regulator with XRE-family HTH domain